MALPFRPMRKKLYVANSDGPSSKAIWMEFNVQPDGTIDKGKVFFDASSWFNAGKIGNPDGMKIDKDGNLWATGPGGLHIFTPDGTHLGTINPDSERSDFQLRLGRRRLDAVHDRQPRRGPHQNQHQRRRLVKWRSKSVRVGRAARKNPGICTATLVLTPCSNNIKGDRHGMVGNQSRAGCARRLVWTGVPPSSRPGRTDSCNPAFFDNVW